MLSVPISYISELFSVPFVLDSTLRAVDADVPLTRIVTLVKESDHIPLGFYIREGTSVRVTPYGLERVPAIFISRLVPGGFASNSGLLAVNDEILEVNGVEVTGKNLDQVIDMIIANSHHLILTMKPYQW